MTSGLFRQEAAERVKKTKPGEEARNAGPASDDRRPDDRALATRAAAALGRGTEPGPAAEPSAGPSVIGAGTEITGQITMRGDFHVDGRIEGNVSTQGEVVISDQGEVQGEIEGEVVVIEGRVDGAVRAHQVVRLKHGCKVSGDLVAPAVELEEGGGFNGRIEMTQRGEERTAITGAGIREPR